MPRKSKALTEIDRKIAEQETILEAHEAIAAHAQQTRAMLLELREAFAQATETTRARSPKETAQ